MSEEVLKKTTKKKVSKTAQVVDLSDRISVLPVYPPVKKRLSKPRVRNVNRIQVDLPSGTQHRHLKFRKFILTFAFLSCTAFLFSDYYSLLSELRLTKIELENTKNKLRSLMISASVDTNNTAYILSVVSEKILLPQNEDPQIITLKNAQQAAQEQLFYTHAIDGDVVIIYPKAKKAIIWSPTRQKIVNAGVVSLSGASDTSEGAATSTGDQIYLTK